MSLRDIINGAAQEAKTNVGDLRQSEDKATDDKDAAPVRKASAAGARPAREAAGSVRVASNNPKTLTKEEKAAERARRREREDLRNKGYELLLRKDPDYKKADRVWWVLLGVGMTVTIICLALIQLVPGATDFSTDMGVVAAVCLVAAYALIIGAFIYDFTKRRPIRRRVEAKAAGLTDKKIAQMIAEARAEAAARRAAKRKK